MTLRNREASKSRGGDSRETLFACSGIFATVGTKPAADMANPGLDPQEDSGPGW